MISIPTGSLTEIYRRVLEYHYLVLKRHVNEHPTMHYFGNPRHAQSMIANKNSTEYFWKIPVKIALWECCYHALLIDNNGECDKRDSDP